MIQILDWAVSALTMGSFLYASINKERFDTSIQFNVANLIAGVVFIYVAIKLGAPGLGVRQLFFGAVAARNLYVTFSKYKNK